MLLGNLTSRQAMALPVFLDLGKRGRCGEQPPWSVVLALLGLTLIVHPAVALIMYCLGLKSRVG